MVWTDLNKQFQIEVSYPGPVQFYEESKASEWLSIGHSKIHVAKNIRNCLNGWLTYWKYNFWALWTEYKAKK